jgi:hypothetical protein
MKKMAKKKKTKQNTGKKSATESTVSEKPLLRSRIYFTDGSFIDINRLSRL